MARAEIALFDCIGADDNGGGITAKQFDEQLKALGDVPDVLVRINSPGGEVMEGLAIYNTLKASPAKITVRVEGYAASSASLIAMAGDRIEIADGAFMLVHEPHQIVQGTAEDMARAQGDLERMTDSFVEIYAERTGMDEEPLRELLKEDRLLTAQEAVEMGFADAVTETMKASIDLSRLSKKHRAAVLAAKRKGNVKMTGKTNEPTSEELLSEIKDLKALLAKAAAKARADKKAFAKALAKAKAKARAEDGDDDGDNDEDENDDDKTKSKARRRAKADDDGDEDDAEMRADDDEDDETDESDPTASDDDDDDEKDDDKPAGRRAKAKAFRRGMSKGVAYAREIHDLCALAGKPHLAARFIADGKSPNAVRSRLMKEDAGASAGATVRTAYPYSGASATAQPKDAEVKAGWDKAFARLNNRAR